MRPRPPASPGVLITGLLVAALLNTSAPVAHASLIEPTPSAPTGAVGGDRLGLSRLQLALAPTVPRPPAPKAAAWLVADLDSRQVLVARDVHRALAPASTMKIFTALTLAPTLDPDAVYTARDTDAAVEGTKVGIVPGSRYTVDQLLHGMLMGSGNDCAHALGSLGGGQVAAIAAMKATALRLGALDTVPRTTSGLDAAGQVSSAYDLALAGAAALQDPQLAAIMHTTQYRFPAAGMSLGPERKTFATQNHNHLLGQVRGATGVKNGYTVAARGSFVGSATRRGHSYLVVLLRAEGNTWRASADLLDWAFAYGDRAGAVGTLVRPGSVPAASTGETSGAASTGEMSGAASGQAVAGVSSHLGGADLATAGGPVGSLQARLDRAGLNGQMIILTTAAALLVAGVAGLLRLQLARRRRAFARRARHHH